MIIKHKEFPNRRVYELDYCGRPLRMEVGLSLIHISEPTRP